MNTRLWEIFQEINEWVRFADTKAGVVLAAHTAVFTVAVPAIVEKRQFFLEHQPLLVGLLLTVAVSLVSAFFGMRCIIPRLSIGEARSLIFFGHIANAYSTSDLFRTHSLHHYEDDEAYKHQILDQIWANSHVAWRKHKDSAYCLWGLICEAILAIGLFVFALFC